MMEHVQTSLYKSKFYEPPQKRAFNTTNKGTLGLKPRMLRLRAGKKATEVKMGPEGYHNNNLDEALMNIVYPEYTKPDERRAFDAVARYRAFIDQPQNNFQQQPLGTGVETVEALIVALDEFAQRLGGELSFSDRETPPDEALNRAACGIANMDTAHLLAMNFIPTAKFSVLLEQDYYCDITRSYEELQNFVLDFVNEMADVAKCSKDCVRVISIEQPGKIRRRTKIKFGLTTTNAKDTEELVENLQVMMSIVSMLHGSVLCRNNT